MNTTRTMVAMVMIAGWGLMGATQAAEPPELINYQGVLRDASDNAIDGTRDMEFRFYDTDGGVTCTGGTLLLTDSHVGVNAIEVTDGMFNVHIGSGSITPGSMSTLAELFGSHSAVWVEVEVAGESLCPRIRVASAGYALNAGNLGGREAGDYVDTSSAKQTKAGPLVLDASAVTPSEYGVTGIGKIGGGYFADSDNTGYVRLGTGDYGLRSFGEYAGAYFQDTNDGGNAYLGWGGYGVRGAGATAGGYFEDSDGGANALIGYSGHGIFSKGFTDGGYFEDADSTGKAWIAEGDRGIRAEGSTTGGYFTDTNDGSYAEVASSTVGIIAHGSTHGGSFHCDGASGYAYLAQGDYGVRAWGNTAGGYFKDRDGEGYSYVGWGNYGIRAFGDGAGGYFDDTNATGYAYVGYGDLGISAVGDEAGGYFKDSSSGVETYVANAYYGIRAEGSYYGGSFTGDTYGAYGRDASAGTYTYVAFGGSSTSGNGAKNFVQNHPENPGEVIVYTALEGDEAGTYTRGSARLVDGEARVALGESFKWVTNPDIGLTAHLTPREQAADLYVASLSTEEMVVRAGEGSPPDAAFDYVVHGLRIGFEELSVVREKDEEAYIPRMTDQQERYARRPELRSFTALERFRQMSADVRGSSAAELDLGRAEALRAAIQVFDPEIHAVGRPWTEERIESGTAADPGRGGLLDGTGGSGSALDTGAGYLPGAGSQAPAGAAAIPVDEEGNVYGRSFRPSASDLASLVPVSEPVEVGDVLVIDPELPGAMGRSRVAADARVLGIVAADAGLVLGARQPAETGGLAGPAGPEGQDGAGTFEPYETEPTQVPVALSGIALCKVDAGYGSILPGDLLTTSPTPGHAMRADEPVPGTILGKALETQETGTGQIKVLVMLR